MKKLFYLFACLSILLAACSSVATPTPLAATDTPAATATPVPPTATATPLPTATLVYPAEGYGPDNFPDNVDPLTGLPVHDPSLLDRRPLLIKVSNLPRNVRPQWGLSLADLVFEYYTEEGTTRFAALFYGNNADMVGPIRSGRFIDGDLVRGYKAIFAFGGAYVAEMDRYLASEYADRLVVEGDNTPLYRYDPKGFDYLMVKTADLTAYAVSKGIDNGRQNLDGMSFNQTVPQGGQAVSQVYVRFSGSIYNRWDYDPTTGRYLRFSDTADDYDENNPQYAQLTDRLTNQPIAFDNLAVLYAAYDLYSTDIYDIQFSGSGDGFVFRDGQAYDVRWQRNATDVVTLFNLDGTPFDFKPGTTCLEVVGVKSTLQQNGEAWSFHHEMP
jgi:hypothetical protein